MSQNLDHLSASMKDANPVSPSDDTDVTARLTRSQTADTAAMAIPPPQAQSDTLPTPQPSATAKSTTTKKSKTTKSAAKNGSTSTNQKAPETAAKETGDAQTKQLSTSIGAKHVIDVDNIPEREEQPAQPTDAPEKAVDELTAIMLEAALKAGREGNQVKSDMYFNCYKALILGDPVTIPVTLVPAATDTSTTELPVKQALVSIPSQPPSDRQEDTSVGGVNFHWGHTNSHEDVGFTPYIEQNLLELKAPLPLTIFNKAWQDAALQYHAEKRPKNDNNSTERGMRYTGYPYSSEWLMSYSDWSLNYSEFLITMRDIYRYETLGQWIVLHKANADKILRKDGFMVALRYDIRIRVNAFAHRVVKDGVSSFSDILRHCLWRSQTPRQTLVQRQ